MGPLGNIAVNSNSTNPQGADCGNQTLNFSVGASANATGYIWDFSNLSGWTYSGSGTSVTAYTDAASGGTVRVTSVRSDAPEVTQTTTIDIVRPNLGSTFVSGDLAACVGQTRSYLAHNVPSGSSVSWSASGNVSISSQSATLANVSYNGNGSGTITATISGCNATVNRNLSV
ncbi:hypothetical protein GCM10028807_25360 [Spirosoma daeguense]